MIRSARIVTAALLAFTISAYAKIFSLSVQKGGAEIVRSETGEQVAITDTASVCVKDMVSLADGQQAALAIESNAVFLLRGPVTLSLVESGNTLTVLLDEGQVLLIRKQPYSYSSVTITSKGFVFTPLGTVAAVKISSDGQPTVAVVEGKMKMQNPGGEAIVIDQGNSGSVGPDGKLGKAVLSPQAVESLREWQATTPVSAATQSAVTPASTATTGRQGGTTGGNGYSVSNGSADAPAMAPATPSTAAAPMSSTTASPAASEKPTVAETGPVAAETAAVPANAAEKKEGRQAADTANAAEKPGAEKVEKTPPPPSSPKWEISAGSVTVDNTQWTRLALGFDLPLWKFGVFFDVELFIDNDGQFSDKGWNFQDDWIDALSRKIRYVRFGQEGEPLFIKIGGLSSVTLGYGFLVDRFTNMLKYPDEKLIGFQFDLNDISPIGITLQTLVADFREFDYDGGLAAARLAIKPLKPTGVPILGGMAIGGSYAIDLNQYAPARKWVLREPVSVRQLNYLHDKLLVDSATAIDTIMQSWGGSDPRVDNEAYRLEKNATVADASFGLIGGDIGIPIIATSLVGLDLYGQAGIRDDKRHGWGIGAPGVALKVWQIWANVEYRRVQGAFQPGYFDRYYLDERLIRNPVITTKEQRLADDTLNGVFGRLGFNIADVLLIEGSYLYMVGQQETSKDQRFEAIGSLGELLLEKIPKLNRAEVYFNKTRIGVEDDRFIEKTPFMHFGYRVGFEITAGASLIFDTRYGYKYDENDRLVPDNNISVQTAISF